jgi:signal transduction histidine kinase
VRNALLALSVAEEKRLGIECSRCGEQVRIVIRDTGIGFGPSEQEHLTDLFFTGWSREIREKDDQESHHGLGLYAASALLEPYGARFSLTREGAETVAIVEIPLGEQA